MKLPESTLTTRSAGQQVVERDRQRARVDAVGRAVVGVGDVAPADLGGDARRELVAAVAGTPAGRLRRGGDRRLAHVADDSDRAGAVGAERLRIVVDLDHGGTVRDQMSVPHRPHVEGAAPPDDQVGAADQLGGERRGEPAGHVERPRAAVEQPLGHGRRREQRSRRVAELLEGDPASGATGPSASDEHESLGPVQRVDERRQVTVVRRDRSAPRRGRGAGRGVGRHRLGLQRQRDVEHDGPAPVTGQLDGGAGLGDRGRRGRDPGRHRRHRGGERGLVHVEVGPRLGHLGRNDDHRRPALGRLGDPRHRVGEAAPLMDRQRRQLSRSSGRSRRPSSPRRSRAGRRRTWRRRRPGRW